MSIKSKIYLSEKVKNKNPRPTADTEYYTAYVEFEDGTIVPAMFTDKDIEKAVTRAKNNGEDMPSRYRSLLDRLLGR